MRSTLFLIALAALAGCASVGVHRDVYDENGRKVATVRASGNLLTSEGATAILASARRLERVKLDGEAEARRDVLDGKAEARTARVAEKSVDKGQPTTVATRGGQMSSGYVGYGYGTYSSYGGVPTPYGYGAYDPSVAPEFVAIEAAGRMPGYLPTLATSVVTQVAPEQGLVVGAGQVSLPKCPTDRMPTTLEEHVACNRVATNALLKDRARASRARHK